MIKATADVHIERKLTHFLGVMGMVLIQVLSPVWLTWVILLGIAIPQISLDFLRLRNEKLNQWMPKIFGSIMRRRELHHITGTTYLFLGTILIFFFFPPTIVTLSLLFLACADPLASYVGIRFGTVKILGKKTFEGTLAAFLVCTGISLAYYHYNKLMLDHWFVAALFSGLIGALTELVPLAKIDDNFTQPVLNSLLLYGLFSLYGGFA
jgi:diacylglycerol kinase (CTP)